MSSAKTRRCPRCNRSRQLRFFEKPEGRSMCNDCRAKAQRKNKKTSKFASRGVRLWETYGITLEEYDALLAAQGGACAICHGVRPYNLSVDHDHAVEKALRAQGVPPMKAARMSVRGLLCKQDNRRLLPAAHDNVENLQSAIEYLLDWPSNQVLGVTQWVP